MYTLTEIKDKYFPTLQDNFEIIAWSAEWVILAPRNENIDKVIYQLLFILLDDASMLDSNDTAIDEHASFDYIQLNFSVTF